MHLRYLKNSKQNYNSLSGNLERAAVELAQEWRGDKQLRQLEAMLIVMDKDAILVVSGTGEVIAQMMTLSLLDQEATTH